MTPHVGGSTLRLAGDEPADIARAADILRAGGLVAFPTETVYGLGADAVTDTAVAKIFVAKGRPADHPLIVHIASADELPQWARDIPPVAWKLAAQFWPGPLTLILKRVSSVAEAASGGLDTIGLRVPGHPVALALLKAFGSGVAAPSANRFGRISPTCVDHVLAELEGRIEAVIDGGPCAVGLESTILDLSSPLPRILRPGAVTRPMLEAILGKLDDTPAGEAPRAPGSLEMHYAPATPLRLAPPQALEAEAARLAAAGAVVVLARHAPQSNVSCRWMRLPAEAAAYGHDLYTRLREADALGSACILIETPPDGAEWMAANDRLQRAAAGSGGAGSAQVETGP
ncbi:MAG: threonylcarbamoyl-AMP synthase [Hydrogenophilales bacterium 17-61-9]|nr:MAG: threonylcarbamoyl-AMP synthase [Hydrogenophilales bacterium 17-61-9]